MNILRKHDMSRRNRAKSFLGAAVTLSVVTVSFLSMSLLRGQDGRVLTRDLADALRREDSEAIAKLVAAARTTLGDEAGVPERPDDFQVIPVTAKPLSTAEAKPLLERIPAQIEKLRWWKIGLDPTKLDHALREPAAIIGCCVRVHRANGAASDRALELARDAGDFLVWAQTQGEVGVFPFPTATGVTKDNAFVAAERYLKQAKRDGRLDQVVRNGWAIDDVGDGGLQFDNGEAGVAMFELYEATREKKYLDSAVRAADWAASRPLVTNWNYNSFSVWLLARAFAVTGERKYLEAATKKARLGVIPGQLIDGPHAGRWLDGHNARPPYHYIMLRSLVALATVMPQDGPERPEVMRSLSLGLKARNKDFVERGASNKDHALQVLLVVNREFAADTAFLVETQSLAALDALTKLISEEARRGKNPTGPRAWGMFLSDALSREER